MPVGVRVDVLEPVAVACDVADERVDLQERDFHSVYVRSHFSLTWSPP